MDNEQPDEDTVTLEKFPTLETVVLLSQLRQKPDDYINATIELDDMDVTSAETKATYDEIKKYVAEHNDGMKVSNLYISQIKKKCGTEAGKNYNQAKSEGARGPVDLCSARTGAVAETARQPQCPKEKEQLWMHWSILRCFSEKRV